MIFPVTNLVTMLTVLHHWLTNVGCVGGREKGVADQEGDGNGKHTQLNVGSDVTWVGCKKVLAKEIPLLNLCTTHWSQSHDLYVCKHTALLTIPPPEMLVVCSKNKGLINHSFF